MATSHRVEGLVSHLLYDGAFIAGIGSESFLQSSWRGFQTLPKSEASTGSIEGGLVESEGV